MEPAVTAAAPPAKRHRGKGKKAAASATAEAPLAPTVAAADEPMTPPPKAKAPRKAPSAKAPAKARANGAVKRQQQQRAASMSSIVPCSDEGVELVDVKPEPDDIKVEEPSPEVARAAKRPKHRHKVADIAEDYVPRELPGVFS